MQRLRLALAALIGGFMVIGGSVFMAAPAQAVTYHPFSKSITGASVSGQWWIDGSGYRHISGTLKDTKADGGGPYFIARFTADCCAQRVSITNGAASTTFNWKSSHTSGGIQYQLGNQNWPWWDSNTGWITLL